MKRFILTTGPSLLHAVPLQEVHSPKNIYRINGAHGFVEKIDATITEIRQQVPQADILIDLPGNKVRTKGVSAPIKVRQGEPFEIPSNKFNYAGFYQHLKKGMTVWANDSTLKFIVESADEKKITFMSCSTGELQNNKGMHVRGIHAGMPFLFDKDKQLIELCKKRQVPFIGLSFVRSAEDIRVAKALIGTAWRGTLISKVETKEAVADLQAILDEVDYILIDRGDLSTDIGVEKVPSYQKYIVEMALYNSKKVFLATQVLKNMELNPIPTIAEINDLYTELKMGVYGVQMSEETAVGKYVKECVRVLERMNEEIQREKLPDRER